MPAFVPAPVAPPTSAVSATVLLRQVPGFAYFNQQPALAPAASEGPPPNALDQMFAYYAAT